MLRAVSMAALVAAVTAIPAGCASRKPQPTPMPAPEKPAVPGPTLPPVAVQKPIQAAGKASEPAPTLAPPLPDAAPPSGAQTVYLQIMPDSSELEVQLLGP